MKIFIMIACCVVIVNSAATGGGIAGLLGNGGLGNLGALGNTGGGLGALGSTGGLGNLGSSLGALQGLGSITQALGGTGGTNALLDSSKNLLGDSSKCNADCGDATTTELLGQLGPLVAAFSKKGSAIDNCKEAEKKKQKLTLAEISQYLTLEGAISASNKRAKEACERAYDEQKATCENINKGLCAMSKNPNNLACVTKVITDGAATATKGKTVEDACKNVLNTVDKTVSNGGQISTGALLTDSLNTGKGLIGGLAAADILSKFGKRR